MKIGDLVDDGFGNLGVIVELGWIFPESRRKEQAYLVHFLAAPALNWWYENYDLKRVFPPAEVLCK